MIANIGPSEYNYNETLTTLRYAHRAKTIQNKPVKNEDSQDAKLKEYQDEIARLRVRTKKKSILFIGSNPPIYTSSKFRC